MQTLQLAKFGVLVALFIQSTAALASDCQLFLASDIPRERIIEINNLEVPYDWEDTAFLAPYIVAHIPIGSRNRVLKGGMIEIYGQAIPIQSVTSKNGIAVIRANNGTEVELTIPSRWITSRNNIEDLARNQYTGDGWEIVEILGLKIRKEGASEWTEFDTELYHSRVNTSIAPRVSTPQETRKFLEMIADNADVANGGIRIREYDITNFDLAAEKKALSLEAENGPGYWYRTEPRTQHALKYLEEPRLNPEVDVEESPVVQAIRWLNDQGKIHHALARYPGAGDAWGYSYFGIKYSIWIYTADGWVLELNYDVGD